MIHMLMQPLHIRLGICPYCGEKLGVIQRLKQKSRKPYKCSRCGKIINEKFIVY